MSVSGHFENVTKCDYIGVSATQNLIIFDFHIYFSSIESAATESNDITAGMCVFSVGRNHPLMTIYKFICSLCFSIANSGSTDFDSLNGTATESKSIAIAAGTFAAFHKSK